MEKHFENETAGLHEQQDDDAKTFARIMGDAMPTRERTLARRKLVNEMLEEDEKEERSREALLAQIRGEMAYLRRELGEE